MDELELPEGDELVAAELSLGGTLIHRTGEWNLALVKRGADDAEGVVCGYETDNGECSREVGSPGSRCWQHEDE